MGNSETDNTLGTVTMTCEGQSFPVVWDQARKSFEGALGGLESDIQATATAQPSNVSNPLTLLQKRCAIDGDSYRIAEVSVGAVAIHFTLTSTNNAK
jgi:hypothetical protein